MTPPRMWTLHNLKPMCFLTGEAWLHGTFPPTSQPSHLGLETTVSIGPSTLLESRHRPSPVSWHSLCEQWENVWGFISHPSCVLFDYLHNNANGLKRSSQRSWDAFFDPEKSEDKNMVMGVVKEQNKQQLLVTVKRLVIHISVTWTQHGGAHVFWCWHSTLKSAQWFDIMIGRRKKKEGNLQ